jgi:phosphate transport system permease protein
MATESETVDQLRQATGTRLRQLRGQLFEATLLGATLVGIVSLLVLFGYLGFDAFRPLTASARWYLLYFGTLVTPTAAFTWYARRNPAIRSANAKSFAVVFGTLALSLVTYVVADSLSPYDVVIYFAFTTVPVLAILAYGRTRSNSRYVGPAIPVAAVVGVLSVSGVSPALRPLAALGTNLVESVAPVALPVEPFVYALGVGVTVAIALGIQRTLDSDEGAAPAVVVAALIGLVVTEGLYGHLRPLVGLAAAWIAYFGIVTLPAAGVLGVVVARRWSPRRGVIATTAVVLSTLLLAGGLIGVGIDPSFWVVLFSVFVVPVGYVVGSTVVTESDGRVGLLGPFLLLAGVLAGAALERELGIQGLESFLTPTLLLNSWHGLNASKAGVYPQIVGSIVIVGFMALLAFPVGVGAAVYLEEYAPQSGWGGRLATILEVNISNLAGVPSVVYGLLGLALFRNTLGFGTGIVVSAAGTLGLLILPIVVVSAQEAIRSVPDSLREASYGMGASRWQTLRNVVFPESVPGILTGTILALARAIGETAPLVIIAVATTTYTPPAGLFESATALSLQIFAASANAKPAFRHGVVPAAAVVLLTLMLLMNATAIVIRNRYDRELKQ